MEKKTFIKGIILFAAFISWTLLVQVIDVKPTGIYGTTIGFATLNLWFHQWSGVHMSLYTITDWLSLIPLFVCLGFAIFGAIQLIKRRSILKVDIDIILLGAYYILVMACFIGFEMMPINYRPILIDGILEASYPSSTTLLVLSVMPTLAFHAKNRIQNETFKRFVVILAYLFTAFVVFARLFSGVHWLTDIIGGALLSAGLFNLYVGCVALFNKNTN